MTIKSFYHRRGFAYWPHLLLFVIFFVLFIGGFLLVQSGIPSGMKYYVIVIGLAGSIATIIQLFLTIRKPKRSLQVRKVTVNQELFVNRDSELETLLDELCKNQKLTNVYGDKGVGKSELLRVLADAINKRMNKSVKKRFKKESLRYLQSNYNALYFDVSDKTGIEDIKRDISVKSFPEQSPSYEAFVNQLTIQFPRKKLVILIDNFNNQALCGELARLIQFHWSVRQHDIFVIGSIDQFDIYFMPLARIEILPLHEKSILEYAEKRGRNLTDVQLKDILHVSSGLPVFLEIILNSHIKDLESAALSSNIKAFIFKEVFPYLNNKSINILKYSSFLNLVTTEVNSQVLEDLGLDDVADNLQLLKQYSLIIGESHSSLRTFKVHDRVRDLVVEKYFMQSQSINANIAQYYRINEKHKEAVIHYIISNSLFDNIDYALMKIREEIGKENLPFLLTIGQIFERFNRTRHIIRTSAEFTNTVLYAHLLATMGIGNYFDASRIVEDIVLGSQDLPRLDAIKKKDEFEFHFLIADLDHLQNKYAQSIDVFRRLYDRAKELNFIDWLPRCLWGTAHSYRHQGKSLEMALEHYKQCEILSRERGDIRYLCKALNGQICIHLIWNDLEFPFERVFRELYEKLTKDKKAGNEVLSTMKYHSIYLRFIGDYPSAQHYLSLTYEDTKKLGKRTIYNIEFEFAEYLRDLKKYEDACKKYSLVYDFSQKNGDRNLKANAMLGIVLTEIATGEFYYHKSTEEVINEVLDIITLTMEADIHITNLQSRIILEFLRDKFEQTNTGFQPNMGKYLNRLNLKREASIYQDMTVEALGKIHLILL